MKVPKKGKDKKEKVKVKKRAAITKMKSRPIRKDQVLVVAQEIKYARLLSGNEKNTRDRVLKALKKWITNCFEKGYEFKEEDFIRVWKGLFYAVWMSDKPLVQEELCESIAGMLMLFPPSQLRAALLLMRAGFRTLATEWYGIDQHRMDKFLMLARRYLRGSLRCLEQCEWSLSSCEQYAQMLTANEGLFALKTPHYARNALSLQLHIMDCFLEELAKVSKGKISGESVSALLSPFVSLTCGPPPGSPPGPPPGSPPGPPPALCAGARRLLTALLRQSPQGLEYADRTRAWEQMGCPEGGPDALALVSDDEEDPEGRNGDAPSDEETNDDGPLDPRAGRVDVALATLPVPGALLAARLRAGLRAAGPRAHKRARICLERFETLSKGEYPLVVSAPATEGSATTSPRRAARALRALEGKLNNDTDELKLRGLSRKHRKRLLRKSRLGQSIVEDVEVLQKAHKKIKNNGWLVESTIKTKEKDTSNKENQNKKKEKQPKDKTLKRKIDGGTEAKQNGVVDSKKIKLEKKTKKDKVSPKKEIVVKKIKEKDSNKTKEKEIHKEIKVVKKTVIEEKIKPKKKESPKLLINKLKTFSKQIKKDKNIRTKEKSAKLEESKMLDTPKKVKFVLKNNSMQKPLDYYKSVRQSPSIPFDSSKKPNKTNLKPSSPSPINPFFKKKLKMKN